jgi:hypothetical protein
MKHLLVHPTIQLQVYISCNIPRIGFSCLASRVHFILKTAKLPCFEKLCGAEGKDPDISFENLTYYTD